MRKGQITLYIILGVILLLAFVLYSNRGPAITPPSTLPADEARLSMGSALDHCAHQSLEKSLIDLGRSGSVSLDDTNALTEIRHVSYYSVGGKETIPTLQDLESQIADDASEYYLSCATGLDFPFDATFAEGPAAINAKINDDSVQLNINWKASAKVGDGEVILSEFKASEPSSLKLIHETAAGIVRHHLQRPDYIDINFLLDQPFDVSIVPVGDEGIAYRMVDYKHELDGVPYTFIFGVQG